METVGVIGVGKLGLCLALILEKAGYTVRSYDNNAAYRTLLREKSLVSIEPGLTDALGAATHFSVDDSLTEIAKLQTVFVVVATPSLADGSYNHSAVETVIADLARISPATTTQDKLLVLCCTVMPGYTQTVQDRMAAHGYNVCYSPEFIAQGDIIKGMTNPDMVLIGGNAAGSAALVKHYKQYLQNDPPFHIMSPVEAEITKISLNCFLTTKIAFANSIGDIVLRAGGEPSVVLSAIGSDSRVGKKFLRWGHGFGGPCLPRDNRALCAYADSLDFKHRIGMTTDEVNKLHVENVADYVIAKNTAGLPYYFDSVVYKRGTTILEESQQLLLAANLAARGAAVFIHDLPEVRAQLEKTHPGTFRLLNAPLVDTASYFGVSQFIN
jgi:UDPglucose 6-dehydrogenase